MAVQRLNTVAGNTAPPLSLTAKRDGVVLDLTGCTVALIITKKGVVTNTGHQTCTISNPSTSGIVTYTRQTGDLSTKGTYTCDLQITYSDLTVEVLYDQLKLNARARADA